MSGRDSALRRARICLVTSLGLYAGLVHGRRRRRRRRLCLCRQVASGSLAPASGAAAFTCDSKEVLSVSSPSAHRAQPSSSSSSSTLVSLLVLYAPSRDSRHFLGFSFHFASFLFRVSPSPRPVPLPLYFARAPLFPDTSLSTRLTPSFVAYLESSITRT